MPELTSEQKLMGALSYLGILVLIPYLTKKGDQFVMGHVKQGLMLLIVDVILWFAGWILTMVTLGLFAPVMMIIWLLVMVVAIIGIVKAAQGQTWVIPVVGKTAASWNL